jgi:hypothetical protein
LDETVTETLRKFIPTDAMVLTTPTVFTHMATNINAYVIPPENSPSIELYNATLNYLKSLNYDYIIYTYFWDKSGADVIYSNFTENQRSYGLFVKGPGFELYKRGFNGSPTKLSIKFSYKELSLAYTSLPAGITTINSVVVDDSSSESGKVIKLKPFFENRTKFVWYGPYITLEPGNYTAYFRVKIENLAPPEQQDLKLEVSSGSVLGMQIQEGRVYSGDFIKPLTWRTYRVSFNIPQRTPEVEFRGLEAPPDQTIWLDYVEVVPE